MHLILWPVLLAHTNSKEDLRIYTGEHYRILRWFGMFFVVMSGLCYMTETDYSTERFWIREKSRLYDEQRDYYRDLTDDLKNYHNSNGKDKGFIGVIWYQLFDDSGHWYTGALEDEFGILESDGGPDPDSDDDAGCWPAGNKKITWYWLKDSLTP